MKKGDSSEPSPRPAGRFRGERPKPAAPKARTGTRGSGAAKHTTPGASPADFTPNLLALLRDVHGDIREHADGECHYGRISTISMPLLIGAGLPAKEVLWAWYQHFEMEQGESVYATVPPAEDEALLAILSRCEFPWDSTRIRESGLLFLKAARDKVYQALENALTARLEAFLALPESELRIQLNAGTRRSEPHLKTLLRKLRQTPLEAGQRESLYASLDSAYQRATARQILENATGDGFWKQPPEALETIAARYRVFATTLREMALRLGVYAEHGRFEDSGSGSRAGGRKTRGAQSGNVPFNAFKKRNGYLALLGLGPQATLPEVKNAYREMVKRHHPDQGGHLPAFLKIQEAYEFLVGDAS